MKKAGMKNNFENDTAAVADKFTGPLLLTPDKLLVDKWYMW